MTNTNANKVIGKCKKNTKAKRNTNVNLVLGNPSSDAAIKINRNTDSKEVMGRMAKSGSDENTLNGN